MKINKIIACCITLAISSTAFALPNPAATNCTNKGFKYLLVQNVGVCLFPDDSYCEEWAFFRGQCKPGQIKVLIGNQNLIGQPAPSNNNNNGTSQY